MPLCEIVKKANYKTCKLYKLQIIIILQAFKYYVRPIVEFKIFAWNPLKKKDVGLPENVQNSFTRKLNMRCFEVPCQMVLHDPGL